MNKPNKLSFNAILDKKTEELLKELDHEKILSQLIYEKSIKEKVLYEKEIQRLERERQNNLRRSQELRYKYSESIKATKDSKENENVKTCKNSQKSRIPLNEINPNSQKFQEKALSPIKTINKIQIKNHSAATQTENKASEPSFLDTAELISRGSVVTALKSSNLVIPLSFRSSSSKLDSRRSSKRSNKISFSPEKIDGSNNFNFIAETSRKNPLDSLPQDTDRNPLLIQELDSFEYDEKFYQVVGDLESLEYSMFSENEI